VINEDFNQQAFLQLAGAQLITNGIIMLTNKKYNVANSAYEVQCTNHTLAFIAGVFGGKDCVLAKELMHFHKIEIIHG
jgi:hypothetical protein